MSTPMPEGITTTWNGYPIFDHSTNFNPQDLWPTLDQLRGEWFEEGLVHTANDPADLQTRFSGLGAGEQRLVGVLSDRSLRWWDGQAWVIVAGGGSGWVNYQMSWKGTGQDDEIAVGSGTKSARYIREGRTIHVEYYIQRSSSTSNQPGSYRFSLPVPARHVFGATGAGLVVTGSAAADEWPCSIRLINTETFVMVQCSNNKRVGRDSHTWAGGNLIQGSVAYEAQS